MSKVRRILLAEDSEQDIELTLNALDEYHLGNTVDVVHDGVEALDYLHRRGKFAERVPGLPVVILLDLKMPRKSGLDVLKELKADPELRKIPVVMLTSSREERDLITSYSLGVNAYVVKPVDFTHFVESIKQLGCFWFLVNEPPPVRDLE